MSPAEHYFENMLFGYMRTQKLIEDPSNTQYLTTGEKRAVEDCAVYILECLHWSPTRIQRFLNQ